MSYLFLDKKIVEGCCKLDCARQQEVKAEPCVDSPLRKDEEILKVHVLNMKHTCTDELEGKLKEKEAELI